MQSLIDDVTALSSRIKRGRAVNVNDRETKQAVISLATHYFEETRPMLVDGPVDADDLEHHDQHWQDLVRLAHGNNKRKSYRSLLASLAKELTALSVQMLTRTAGATRDSHASTLTPLEEQLIVTLEDVLPTAAASYRQGLLDLQSTPRLSYRGTAAEFREALRETLDHLAPDDDVTAQTGFRLEEDQKKPTMKQKVRFVMKSRGRSSGQRATTEKSVTGVEELVGDVLRATYGRASIATHLETTRSEVLRIKQYVDTVLFDLLELSGED